MPEEDVAAAKRSLSSLQRRFADGFIRIASKPRSPTCTMYYSTSLATRETWTTITIPRTVICPKCCGPTRTANHAYADLQCVGEQLRLIVYGINSPGHFLAAVENGSRPVTSRPALECTSTRFSAAPCLLARISFDESKRRLAEPPTIHDWLAAATHRQWLGRMLNNLQAVFAHAGRERDLRDARAAGASQYRELDQLG